MGEPDVYPTYGDIPQAWGSATPDDQREFIELGFEEATRINGIAIYETFNPGAVDAIYVKNPNSDSWELSWSGMATVEPAMSRIFRPDIPLTDFPVNEVRIELNSPEVPGWNEIDAVCVNPFICKAPMDIEAALTGSDRFTASWISVEGAETYRFRARYKGTKRWHERVLRFGTRATTTARLGGTVEFQVQTICGDTDVSEYSDIMEITIPGAKGSWPSDNLDDIVITENAFSQIRLFPKLVGHQFSLSGVPETGAELHIYTIAGQRVLGKELSPGADTHVVDAQNLREGTYLVVLQSTGSVIHSERIIVVRE